MDKACNSSNPYKNPALMAATLQYIAMEQKGKNISVMMPYADSLKLMADWYCQLWGESLGKAVDFDGNVVHKGQTPVKSLGVTDQHSQVQLYTEGPFDKVVTFIGVKKYRGDVVIANGAEEFADVNFLCGHTMGELINTEREATEYALTRSKHMNRTIMLDEVNANTIGQLLMFSNSKLHTAARCSTSTHSINRASKRAKTQPMLCLTERVTNKRKKSLQTLLRN